MTYGFSFKGIASTSVGISMRTPLRTIKPASRVIEYKIPGRSGTVEYVGDSLYEKISIAVPIVYSALTVAGMNDARRAIGQFLAGAGQLIFDDEPDKYYTAKVVDSPTPEEIVTLGRATITFDCQPFAEGVTLNEQESASETLPHTETVTVEGTQDTPCIIYITAETNISSITIERKATV